MPHYKDGTRARAGDWVRGTTYNQPNVIEGVVLRITSDAEACNCVVGWVELGEGASPGNDEGEYEFKEDYTAVAELERKGRLPVKIDWVDVEDGCGVS